MICMMFKLIDFIEKWAQFIIVILHMWPLLTITIMHSSRMRTARSLTMGGSAPGGLLQGGLLWRGIIWPIPSCIWCYLYAASTSTETHQQCSCLYAAGWSCDLQGMLGYHPPLSWTEFLTHVYENIALPQTSFAGGKNNNRCHFSTMVICNDKKHNVNTYELIVGSFPLKANNCAEASKEKKFLAHCW